VAVEPSYENEKGEEKIEVIYHVFILSHGLLASYNRSRFDVIIFTNSSRRFNAFFTRGDAHAREDRSKRAGSSTCGTTPPTRGQPPVSGNTGEEPVGKDLQHAEREEEEPRLCPPAMPAVGDNTKGPKPTAARPAAKVRFAVDMPTAEPTRQQDRRAPIKMVGEHAWSPGIYRSLRLLGKSLDVAWERAFIHPLTFN